MSFNIIVTLILLVSIVLSDVELNEESRPTTIKTTDK